MRCLIITHREIFGHIMRYHDYLILFWQFSLEILRKNMRDYTHKSWRWFQPISLMFQILWSTKFPFSPIFCKVGALPDCPGWWVYPCSPSDRDGGQLASVVWSFPIHFVQPFFEKEFHRMKLEFGCHVLILQYPSSYHFPSHRAINAVRSPDQRLGGRSSCLS